ncbi:hypothetical protein FGK60_05690 [Streptomyces sp. DASNCL29]|nr:hypothetical protein FGK60_05690 [Streptomyces sp. DASNCL29]
MSARASGTISGAGCPPIWSPSFRRSRPLVPEERPRPAQRLLRRLLGDGPVPHGQNHPDEGGEFVFPRAVLCERGVVSRDRRGGKRGFRVYPPWVTTANRQARGTQAWQVNHFLHLGQDGPAAPARAPARALYRP